MDEKVKRGSDEKFLSAPPARSRWARATGCSTGQLAGRGVQLWDQWLVPLPSTTPGMQATE